MTEIQQLIAKISFKNQKLRHFYLKIIYFQQFNSFTYSIYKKELFLLGFYNGIQYNSICAHLHHSINPYLFLVSRSFTVKIELR